MDSNNCPTGHLHGGYRSDSFPSQNETGVFALMNSLYQDQDTPHKKGKRFKSEKSALGREPLSTDNAKKEGHLTKGERFALIDAIFVCATMPRSSYNVRRREIVSVTPDRQVSVTIGSVGLALTAFRSRASKIYRHHNTKTKPTHVFVTEVIPARDEVTVHEMKPSPHVHTERLSTPACGHTACCRSPEAVCTCAYFSVMDGVGTARVVTGRLHHSSSRTPQHWLLFVI